ncbi:N-acetylglucosamine-6-phosphate deacetylase [Fictibacillus phosphorivorans]|uniref:N-acetylglucosamine-6-phosphate deacetylase n=1 Tax=Fictibacillus phosphorivorans TaxID=1221500 RepID=A0A160IQK3_9BACL|nr:N-acetylglucosamine-6-phosphate deacetylase [Fictibacillus phosphorivorans]ANC78694.1 N-acetylglucosamine-6-phosphate deacetylase [Fictibacillus phosphorivorans]
MVRNKITLRNASIYGENETVHRGSITIQNGKIIDLSTDSFPGDDQTEVIELLETYHIVPGMIDVHIHGAAGADTMDATFDALETIASVLPQEGTTSFLATTMTQEQNKIEKALENAGLFIEAGQVEGTAETLGIHLEGPFISEKRAGAQPVGAIIKPKLELFKQWQKLASGHIKLVTIAPEIEGSLEVISYLHEQNIVASIGHSDATYEEVVTGIKAGASHVTHLYNGMRGLHHREPGVVGAALLNDELTTELIADGIHVRPELISLTYKQKGNERVVLVTDAMRAKCLGDGQYDLGGQEVTVQHETATLKDGTLAGSIIKMNTAVKNMMQFTGCSISDIIQMTSVNPAKELNVFDRKGSLAPGKDADIVVLDEDYEVVMTFCKGNLAYRRGDEV